MTAYLHDGTEFDLDCAYVDAIGVEWRWNGQRNQAGEPLMIGAGPETPIPLPDVYRDHGPLIPITSARALTADMVRDAFTGTVVA